MTFLIISALIIIYYIAMVIRNPASWLSHIHLIPIITFMTYARICGMHAQAWMGAFELSGLVALVVIAILWHRNVIMDRIMLGLNIFLIIGAAGFLFNIDMILDWYSNTKGGPLFGCIALVGLITALSTKTGFIGVVAKKKETINYTSFLLLAATFIALVWSVSADTYGMLWAVVLPFILLKAIRHQLVTHLI